MNRITASSFFEALGIALRAAKFCHSSVGANSLILVLIIFV
jgi:hypothetical protein